MDDVLRALIRAHEKVGDLRRALEYVDQLGLSSSATRQLHQQLAQIQQEELCAPSWPILARLAATVAATHHEWWNGTGYPKV